MDCDLCDRYGDPVSSRVVPDDSGGIFGGAAFGVLGGTLYAGTATLLGATLGASILFTAVKTLASNSCAAG